MRQDGATIEVVTIPFLFEGHHNNIAFYLSLSLCLCLPLSPNDYTHTHTHTHTHTTGVDDDASGVDAAGATYVVEVGVATFSASRAFFIFVVARDVDAM